MYYIGMDCHIANLEIAVVNEKGQVVKREGVKTSEKGMMECIRSVGRPRKVIIEEGCLAGWVKEICETYKEELLISDPKENRWIGRSGQKGDQLDAEKLAQLARGNYVKEIYHPVGEKRRLRELVLAYHDAVSLEIRLKNKIKAKYRQNGILCSGRTVYQEKHRDFWREKLSRESISRLIVEGLWKQLDETRRVRVNLVVEVRKQKKKYPEIGRFMDVEGIGLIHAVTIYALVETPYRFATKKRLFGYFGLGIHQRSSGARVYSTRLTRDYNRRLKATIKQATESALRKKEGAFQQQYLKLTLQDGLASHRAKLTVSRSMVAVLYAMWLSGKEYDPTRQAQDRARYIDSGPSSH